MKLQEVQPSQTYHSVHNSYGGASSGAIIQGRCGECTGMMDDCQPAIPCRVHVYTVGAKKSYQIRPDLMKGTFVQHIRWAYL